VNPPGKTTLWRVPKTAGDEVVRIEINQDGQACAELTKDRAARDGRTICTAFTPAGLDFNEALRGPA
jgi:hypothetical protein